MASFLVQLQVLRLTTLRKSDPSQMLSCELSEALQNMIFKETVWRLLLISNNILGIITRVESNILLVRSTQ